MKELQTEVTAPHTVSLNDRERLTVGGVSDVGSFDEQTVLVETTQGLLTVRGRGLHIGRLNLEAGELTVEGTVDSLTYSEPRGHGSRLGRLFR